MTVNERQKYDSIMWTEIDRIATTNFAVKQAEARGREEGRKEGRELERSETLRKVAKAMLAAGKDVEEITRFTGLTKDQIEE